MTINHQLGDVDARGATMRAQAAGLEAEHQAIVCDVRAAGEFRGRAAAGSQLPGDIRARRKVQTTGSNMARTDSAVVSSWLNTTGHNDNQYS